MPDVDEHQAVTDDTGMWAVVEMLGHRRVVGRVSETTLAGAGFLLVELVNADGSIRGTQYVAPASIYAITPTTRDRVLADRPQLELTRAYVDDYDDYDGDDEDAL
jgi:hypothetical protein